MKRQETIMCFIALLILLLIIGVVLKIIVEAFGLIVILVVLWYAYTHILQNPRK